MACFSGPEITQNGLVFHYDISNFQKSWRGKPTTNLASGNFFNGNGNFTVNRNVSDIMPDGSDGIARELNAQTVVDANRTVSIGSYSLTAGLTYTLSFYVKNINCTGFSGNLYSPTLGRVIGGISYPQTSTTSWTRVVTTFTVPNEGTNPVVLSPQVFRDGGFGLFRMTWLMLEEGSVVSAYTPTLRSTTQSILDLANNTTITANSLTYQSDGTFKLNGTSNIFSVSPSITITSSYAIDAWIKRDAVNVQHGIMSDYQYGWWLFYVNSGNKLVLHHSRNSPSYVVNEVAGSTNIGMGWTHVTGVFDATAGIRLYVNGILDGSNSNTAVFDLGAGRGPQFIGVTRMEAGGVNSSYFNGNIDAIKIYNRALSADEVRQNFNALRGRYGI